MERLAEPIPADLSPRERETFDRIADGPRAGVRGPFAAWIRSPDFADRAEVLGRYCRFENALAPKINELAILLVARHWCAAFAWEGHLGLAREAGVPDMTIQAIRIGAEPHFDDEADQAAYEFVVQLLETRDVDDDAWSRAVGLFGQRGVVDLIGVTGYYGLVAMTLKACHIGSGLPDPFASPI